MGGDEDIDEPLRELVKLGAKPREVNEFRVRVRVGVGNGIFGGGRRELGDERSEERLEREERFEGVLWGRIGGDEGEEKGEVIDVSSRGQQLLSHGFQLR